MRNNHTKMVVATTPQVCRSRTVKALGVVRFQLKYSAGPLPHDKLMRSIELYGRTVVARARDMLA